MKLERGSECLGEVASGCSVLETPGAPRREQKSSFLEASGHTRADFPILNHDFCIKPTDGLSLSSSFISFAVTNAFTRRQRENRDCSAFNSRFHSIIEGTSRTQAPCHSHPSSRAEKDEHRWLLATHNSPGPSPGNDVVHL